VYLAQQTVAERQPTRLDRFDPVIHGGDVVDGFFDVFHRSSRCNLVLEEQQVRKRRHRSLDLRRENRLLANEGVEELGWIGKQQGDPVKPPQRVVRLVEQAMQVHVQRERWLRWERLREEGDVLGWAFLRLSEFSRPPRDLLRGPHGSRCSKRWLR